MTAERVSAQRFEYQCQPKSITPKGISNMKNLLVSTCLCLTASLAMPLAVYAQPLAPAVATTDPQTAIFNGTNSISLPGAESLNLSDVSTIEFWVKPNWQRLNYAPILLSLIDQTSIRYAVFMTADKKSVGLYSGTDWDFVEFDFDDGKSHHVAFVNLGDLTDVFIDGELIGSISVTLNDIRIQTFNIGSTNGVTNPFIGSLSEIRLWDTALDEADIAAFMRIGILSSEGRAHPDFDSLVGVSDFARGRRNFALVDNSSTMEELIDDLVVARGYASKFAAASEPVLDENGKVIEPLTAEELAEFNAPAPEAGALPPATPSNTPSTTPGGTQ